MSEHNNDHKHENSSDQSSTFLMGVIIGAALTYLFATKTGQKIKNELIRDAMNALEGIGDEIEEKKDEIEENVKAKLESVKEKIEDKKEEIDKKLEEKKEDVEATLAQVPDQAKEQVQEAIREVPPQVEKVQKKGRHFFFRKRQRNES